MIGSIALTLAGAELALRLVPAAEAPTVPGVPAEIVARAAARHAVTEMPEAWRERTAEAPWWPGARRARWWHGALHVEDRLFMRRSGPIPPKSARRRIAFLGDSFTYGVGIQDADTFAARAAARLGAESVNLGVPGAQSEQVVGLAQELLPGLDADLVVYSVCLNDLLPRLGLAQEPVCMSAEEPRGAPSSRVAQVVLRAHDEAMRRLWLAPDFFGCVTRWAEPDRFSRDARALTDLTRSLGVPLVVMVVDHMPEYGGPGHRLTQIAEGAFARAGADVIGTEAYYREHDGRDWRVSAWEGHPNEVAHWLWAEMLAERIGPMLTASAPGGRRASAPDR